MRGVFVIGLLMSIVAVCLSLIEIQNQYEHGRLVECRALKNDEILCDIYSKTH